jgi:hypothetical protein
MLALITPTRARPRALTICEDYVRRFERPGGVVWITVEGVPMGSTVLENIDTMHYRVRHEQPDEMSPLLSLAHNVRQGVRFARMLGGDDLQIAIIEDDDWYAPDYLTWLCPLVKEHGMVGEGNAIYYNVRSRTWQELRNTRHASLCSTAWDDSAVGDFVDEVLRECVQSAEGAFLDVRLWKSIPGHISIPVSHRVVGLKGLPGKRGIGVGHQDQPYADLDMAVLRQLIGADADRYVKMHQHNGFA